jgi:isopenicillin-N epimerase
MAVTVQGVEVSWDRVRDLFPLDPAITYLNHGGFGVVPIPVQRAQQRLRDEMDANPMAFFSRGVVDRIAHTRRHVAAFLGASGDGVALVPNASAATQLVLNAVDPGPGDEIVVTDHTYGATALAVDTIGERRGSHRSTVHIPLTADDDEIVGRLVAAVRPGRTRLVIVDHITSPTARLLPVARIAAAVHQHENVAVYVDGAHAPGMLALDVPAIGADFWVGNLHKWAFAPRPTAAFAVAPHWRERVVPLVVSWEQPQGFPAAVEFGGTLDYTAWLAAPTGLHLLRTLDPDRVRQHNVALVEYGQRVVGEALGLTPDELPHRTGPVSMRLIPLPDRLDEAAARELQSRLATEHRIEVALTKWPARRALRVSAQIYNRPADFDRLADAVATLTRQHPGSRAA